MNNIGITVGFKGSNRKLHAIIPKLLEFTSERHFSRLTYDFFGKEYVPEILLKEAFNVNENPIFSFEKKFNANAISNIKLAAKCFGFVRTEIRNGKRALYITSSGDIFFVGLSIKDFNELKKKFHSKKINQAKKPFDSFTITL